MAGAPLGRPGDVGAAVAATLLDREASDIDLQADPNYTGCCTHEPILKVWR